MRDVIVGSGNISDTYAESVMLTTGSILMAYQAKPGELIIKPGMLTIHNKNKNWAGL